MAYALSSKVENKDAFLWHARFVHTPTRIIGEIIKQSSVDELPDEVAAQNN